MTRPLVIAIWLMCHGGVGSAQELTLGGVRIPLGSPEGSVLAQLLEQFQIREIEGGWEVRSRDAADLRTPMVGVGAKGTHP